MIDAMTNPTPTPEVPKKTDIESFVRAQQAMKAAGRGERLQAVMQSKEPAAPAARAPAAKKAMKPFDATAREAAVHRAVSLLRTMTGYYGITMGELEDEEKRLRQLPDDGLRGTITAYEFTSRHVGVILVDEKARDAAIHRDPAIAAFYDQHGANEDDLNQAARESSQNKARRTQPA